MENDVAVNDSRVFTKVTKEEIKAFMQEYMQSNNRAVPLKEVVRALGVYVPEVVAEMKQNGEILGRRGRTGGLVFPETVFKQAVNT